MLDDKIYEAKSPPLIIQQIDIEKNIEDKEIEENDIREEKAWKFVWELFLKKFLDSKDLEEVNDFHIFSLNHNRQLNKKKEF